MSEHTQGKWEVKPKLANGTRHFNIVVNMPEKVICQTNVPGFGGLEPSPREIKANADRICRCVNSHDELLEACKKVVSKLHGTTHCPELFQACKAAIAKVET